RENRWRAMRYSFDQGLIDLGRGHVIPFPQLLEELIELVAEDADALGCLAELEHARSILSRGTSAHRQLAVRADAIAGGASPEEADRAVVDHGRLRAAYGKLAPSRTPHRAMNASRTTNAG